MSASGRLTSLARQCLRSLDGGAAGLVVAVSGGPDSVALLRALLAVRASPCPLVIAHLNHQLRGAESDADEDFVAGLAMVAPNLRLHRHRLDMAARARESGTNLEALARVERYRWLSEVARAEGMRWVATGHTADDQAETVLHRLLRGTGLQGLRGIAAHRELEPGIGLVRPLLRGTRADVLAYLEELGQSYRQDSSNADLRQTRNRIRHELLPHLAARYNPGVVSVLGRLAEQAEEAFRDDEAATAALLHAAELPRAGALLVFDRACLASAPRRLVRGMFRLLWAREGWSVAEMGYEDWERLTAVALGEVAAVDLPGHVHARARERVVQVNRG